MAANLQMSFVVEIELGEQFTRESIMHFNNNLNEVCQNHDTLTTDPKQRVDNSKWHLNSWGFAITKAGDRNACKSRQKM